MEQRNEVLSILLTRYIDSVNYCAHIHTLQKTGNGLGQNKKKGESIEGRKVHETEIKGVRTEV